MDSLVVIVHSYCKNSLCSGLTNNIFFQVLLNFAWGRYAKVASIRTGFIELFGQDVVTKFNTFVANVDPWACN